MATKRYAFNLKQGQRLALPNTQGVRRLNVYDLEETLLEDVPEELYDEITIDDTRVGTRIKQTLKLMGIPSGSGCTCDAFAATLDKASTEWIDKNFNSVCGQIAANAAAMKVPAPMFAIKRLVRYAIRKERKRNNA